MASLLNYRLWNWNAAQKNWVEMPLENLGNVIYFFGYQQIQLERQHMSFSCILQVKFGPLCIMANYIVRTVKSNITGDPTEYFEKLWRLPRVNIFSSCWNYLYEKCMNSTKLSKIVIWVMGLWRTPTPPAWFLPSAILEH